MKQLFAYIIVTFEQAGTFYYRTHFPEQGEGGLNSISPNPTRVAIFKLQTIPFVFRARGECQVAAKYLIFRPNHRFFQFWAWILQCALFEIHWANNFQKMGFSSSLFWSAIKKRLRWNYLSQQKIISLIILEPIQINISWIISWITPLWLSSPQILIILRYESSTLILYKELSSSIFQSCQSVSEWVRHG